MKPKLTRLSFDLKLLCAHLLG